MEKRNGKAVVIVLLGIVLGLSIFSVIIGKRTRPMRTPVEPVSVENEAKPASETEQ